MLTGRKSIIEQLGQDVRKAAFILSQAPDAQVNAALADLEDLLRMKIHDLCAVNETDLAASSDLSAAMRDRLTLNPPRINAMADSVGAIRDLNNPCGVVLEEWTRPNGLQFLKVSVPIGVLGMIYESRPNVTIDAAALALKSRNAIILRGGSESLQSNIALHALIEQALIKNGLPPTAVGLIKDTDRALVGDMLAASHLIDVLIPRGGKNLTGRVMAEAKMPVFAHLDGNCHIYVHASAKEDMILSVVKNAKLRRTGVCGAMESLLLDKSLDEAVIRKLLTMLLYEGVEIVGDEDTQLFDPKILPASEEDWCTEYLDKKLSCKFVSGVEDAVAHINRHGSHHTDSILSEDTAATDYFLKYVDSAIVLHNASTQFADGGEFGFGAEIGIGTGKLHARGPVGARQLTTFKYIVRGDGQTRP